MNSTRIEKDSMGQLEVPQHALYSAQTQRAINNFPVSGQTLPITFIRTLLQLKACAALANAKLNCLDELIANTIAETCHDLCKRSDLMSHFPVDIFQTGSGTSTNMNANEVIAAVASQKLGIEVNPNDHVNFAQSSNDVIPTVIHASAAIELHTHLLPSLKHLSKTIVDKAQTVSTYCKTGRTHLMDAMPITMDQPLSGWATQIQNNIYHLEVLQSKLQTLAQGGTAVGTGVNADQEFAHVFCQIFSKEMGVKFTPADNYFALISSQDTAVTLSGQLKTTAVSLMKIANDLRWMNSGPLAGLGEISLQALQPGSSIMPGKVNPVIAESTAMVAAQVIGNDAAITIGGQSGNFELNVMLPMIASNLLNSINILANSSQLLADKAIATFTVNEDNLSEALYRNPILVTALNPVVGYQKAAEIAKLAYQNQRPVLDVAAEKTSIPKAELEQLLNPKKLTRGGL